MKTFKQLGLSSEFVSLLEKANITTPTEIQEKTIPLVLAGKDVIGGSATGSGKTLAFASGIVENLEKMGEVQALILTPTRELAEQVSDSVKKFSAHKHLRTLAIYGGVNIVNQMRLLKNADVVVGTPGRIIDHLNRRTLDLRNVKFLVLDEVDRMFDMGFQKDVKKILDQCPKDRQTMLFSATISSEIDYLAGKYTKHPAEVSVKSHIDPSKLKQVYYDVPDGLKFSLLVHLFKKEKGHLVMVFCGTRRNVDFVTKNLNNLGIEAKAIHGGIIQNKRNRVLSEFNSKTGVNVLVCTDVAARGLDIQGVSHVYNYDLPKTSAEYIHRIGRTARAGKDGIAINILCSRDYINFGTIKEDKKLLITEVPLPVVERVHIIVEQKRNFRGGSFNNRRSPSGRGFQRRDSGRQSFRGGSNSYSKKSGTGFVGRKDSRDKPRENKSFGRTARYTPKHGVRGQGRTSDERPQRKEGGRNDYNRDSSRDNRGFSRGRTSEERPQRREGGRQNYNRDRPRDGRRSEGSRDRKTFSDRKSEGSRDGKSFSERRNEGRRDNRGFSRKKNERMRDGRKPSFRRK